MVTLSEVKHRLTLEVMTTNARGITPPSLGGSANGTKYSLSIFN